MLGTIVNALGIIIASLLGVKIKGGISKRYNDIIMDAIPLAVVFIGISSTIFNMAKSKEPILFIISLLIGSLIGEFINIEKRLDSLSLFLQNFSKNNKEDSNFSKGFVSATLIFCIGSMAIIGAIESGLKGNHTILYAKSILDTITSFILASTFGIGVMFSGIAVFIYQGLITVFASFFEVYITEAILTEISIVGGILIFSLGISMLGIKKMKTINMLPAIFIPVFYYMPFIQKLISLLKSNF